MWTISELKENARAALRNFYWLAVLAGIIVGILSGSGFSSSGSSRAADDYMERMNEERMFSAAPTLMISWRITTAIMTITTTTMTAITAMMMTLTAISAAAEDQISTAVILTA